jgi:uncharacterized protein (TIGR04255 family)
MAFTFPSYEDIRLEKPPLVEVICQIRFPPILRIARSEPSEFQDLIRNRFPVLGIEQGIIFPISQSGANVPSPEIQSRVYKFATDDGKSFASLSVDFYAVSTNSYHHWEEFADHLALIHDAITRIYQPNYATRIGLRFVNRLTAFNTGSSNFVEMLSLLRPELVSQLHTNVWDEPDEAVTQTMLADGNGKLALRTAFGHELSDREPFFVLDYDYFEEGRIELIDVVERCRKYHNVIYRAFRWCFLDEKMRAFHPVA